MDLARKIRNLFWTPRKIILLPVTSPALVANVFSVLRQARKFHYLFWVWPEKFHIYSKPSLTNIIIFSKPSPKNSIICSWPSPKNSLSHLSIDQQIPLSVLSLVQQIPLSVLGLCQQNSIICSKPSLTNPIISSGPRQREFHYLFFWARLKKFHRLFWAIQTIPFFLN